MIIRPYTATDKPACLQAFESNMPRFFALHERTDYAGWLDTIGHRDAAEGVERYYVVEQNGAVIGAGGFFADVRKGLALMAWGFISRAHHKRGLGKALFRFRVQEIRALCPHCTIQLDTTQHSYPFFGKLGFRVTKVTEHFYGEDLHRYDMELPPAE